jgi:DNA-binding FadR family transcriptional regulator
MHEAADARDVTALVQADLQFHRGLAEAGGNDALVELITLINDQLLAERAAVLDMDERSTRSLEETREIYEAVLIREPSLARAALIRHLYSVEGSIAKLITERDADS